MLGHLLASAEEITHSSLHHKRFLKWGKRSIAYEKWIKKSHQNITKLHEQAYPIQTPGLQLCLTQLASVQSLGNSHPKGWALSSELAQAERDSIRSPQRKTQNHFSYHLPHPQKGGKVESQIRGHDKTLMSEQHYKHRDFWFLALALLHPLLWRFTRLSGDAVS